MRVWVGAGVGAGSRVVRLPRAIVRDPSFDSHDDGAWQPRATWRFAASSCASTASGYISTSAKTAGDGTSRYVETAPVLPHPEEGTIPPCEAEPRWRCNPQVAEVNGRNRTTVIVPESGWTDFRDILNGATPHSCVSRS